MRRIKKIPVKLSKNQFLMIQDEHKSDSNIARYLNVSRQYVFSIRKEYRIPRVKDTLKTERDKSIIQLLSLGKTMSEVADDKKISIKTVWRVFHNFKDKVVS